MSLVWEHYPAGGGELLTALAYADHAHDDGTGVRPSVAYIARKTRQSERTVQRYLTQMRESGWLLTVRHGDGGRGRATEYRINPLWIINPVRLTPFAENQAERMTNGAQKGDTGGMKRVTPVSPQSSLTVLEPTTTSATDLKQTPVPVDKLIWPASFQKSTQTSVEQILQDCPAATRQLVLDETAGLVERGRFGIRSRCCVSCAATPSKVVLFPMRHWTFNVNAKQQLLQTNKSDYRQNAIPHPERASPPLRHPESS